MAVSIVCVQCQRDFSDAVLMDWLWHQRVCDGSGVVSKILRKDARRNARTQRRVWRTTQQAQRVQQELQWAQDHEGRRLERLERARIERENQRRALDLARLEREQLERERRDRERCERAALKAQRELEAEERELVGTRRAYWARNGAEFSGDAFRAQAVNGYQLSASLERPTLLDVIEDLAQPSVELTSAVFREDDDRFKFGTTPLFGRHNWRLLRRHYPDFNLQLAELDQKLVRLHEVDGVPERRLNRIHAAKVDDEDWRAALVQLIAYGI